MQGRLHHSNREKNKTPHESAQHIHPHHIGKGRSQRSHHVVFPESVLSLLPNNPKTTQSEQPLTTAAAPEIPHRGRLPQQQQDNRQQSICPLEPRRIPMKTASIINAVQTTPFSPATLSHHPTRNRTPFPGNQGLAGHS